MHLQVTFTCANKDEAKRIADALVDLRLAACVQIVGPIASVYRWQGKIEEDEEWLCFAKTIGEQYQKVEDLIRKLHSYDTPEIIATKIENGSTDYLDWLDRAVAPDQ